MSALRELLSSSLAMRELDLVLKVTALLVLGLLVAALLRDASAAIRHFVWTLVLSGSAALAVFSAAAPRIPLRLSVLSEGTGGPSAVARNGSPKGAKDRTPPIRDAARSDLAHRDALNNDASPVAIRGADAQTGIVAVEQATSGQVRWRRLTWTPSEVALLLAAIWFLGALLVFSRLMLGHVAVAHLKGSATPLVDPEHSNPLRAAAALMRVRRPVQLLMSANVTVPITAGVLHPVIVLPPDAAFWSDERVRIVLIHELAHIARLDYLTQIIASAACALFWFHPGVWLASQRLRAEGEQAADDRVLNAGAPNVIYATHLLEIARHGLAVHGSAAVTLGMVRGGASHFERRLRAMLDTTRSRATLSPRMQAVTGGLALLAMIPVAGIRTELAAAPVQPPPPSASSLSDASAPRLATLPVLPTADGVRTTRGLSSTAALQPTTASDRAESRRDSTFERTLRAASGERIAIDLESGGSVTVHAWGEPNVRLRAELGGRDWRDTRVAFERVDGGVRLEATQERSRDGSQTSHEFELWVPRHFDIALTSAGGGITITDIEGDFSGHTGGGPIQIERATGSSSLSTGGGDIRVSDSELRGTIRSGGGTVLLSNVRGGLRASSGGGPVIYAEGAGESGATGASASSSRRSTENPRVTGSLEGVSVAADRITVGDGVGPLHVSNAGGRISLERVPRGGTLHTGGGDIFVGASGGVLSANTGGGDIELRRVAGDAKATTGAGNVTITIVNTDGTEHSVEVRSGTGRVVLQLPQEINARFDLETAYTDSYGRRTTIESDWKLDREETTAWDDREGSPRKYVRAQGAFGSGAGLIRIRTVNGDITVSRAGR